MLTLIAVNALRYLTSLSADVLPFVVIQQLTLGKGTFEMNP